MNRTTGIRAALGSALFLGLSPVFGRQAILLGFSPLAVVALRTSLATLLILALIMFTRRTALFIYPAGLLGCLLAGVINGAGSLLFYSSLARINASLGQLLNSMYPLFVAFWLTLDRQAPGRLTLVRLLLSLPALYLLTQSPSGAPDLTGMVMMLGAAVLYALHLPINQRVLYDMPPQTVTFYTLLAMSLVVVPAFLIFDTPSELAAQTGGGWTAVLGLTVVTFFSRMALFTGVKHIGGMQTALLGLTELLVTIFVAYFWLGEHLVGLQWIGAFLLVFVISLVAIEKNQSPPRLGRGFLDWLGSVSSKT